jgi:hypothetical protein
LPGIFKRHTDVRIPIRTQRIALALLNERLKADAMTLPTRARPSALKFLIPCTIF